MDGTGFRGAGAYNPAQFIEPTLDQLLADPLIRQVMQSDGWGLPELRALLEAAAQGNRCAPAPVLTPVIRS